MSCSSSTSQTFSVIDYGSHGKSGPINFQLSRGFQTQMVLSTVATTSTRTCFDVKDSCGNILLHISRRIDQNVVVFNSHLNSWGPEERVSITDGNKYRLHIVYQPDGYQIFYNGEHFYFYKHRINNNAVSFEINGGLIYSLTYGLNDPIWASQYKSSGMYIQEFPSGRSTPLDIQLQGCNSFSWLILTGTTNCNAQRFDINLISCSGEIIFHFNPRFNENCVVRNSCITKRWGTEERHGGMPFEKNKRYSIAIAADINGYKTYINGEEFITYNHRKPVTDVTKLQVGQDISVFKVVYQK